MRPRSRLEAGRSGAGATRIGGAESFVGIGINADRFCKADPAGFGGEFVAAGFEISCHFGWEVRFEENCVRKPLLMETRRVDYGLRIVLEYVAEAHPVEEC